MKLFRINLFSEVEFEGIDYKDAPEFCDAYIAYALYDGKEMTEEEIEELNDNKDTVFDLLEDYLY